MRRFFVIWIILLILILQNSFSQRGYKQFKWGMTVEKVSSLIPDLKNEYEGWKGLAFSIPPAIAFYFKHGANPDGTIPNPFADIGENIDVYTSEGNGMKFVFYDSSLIAVIIEQTVTNENSFSNVLDKKYGYIKAQGMQFGSVDLQIKAWFNSGDRIITFQRGNYNDESVTYLDKTFFDKYASPIIKKLKKENRKQKNRLD